ncbi:hypothetical protein [Streptomyces sp. NBC_00280]|uniref:hypothetical protein n=1 Tax=Streptomyces sp. NBC_00280 TaxID=2975699 RepID=UPI00324623C2
MDPRAATAATRMDVTGLDIDDESTVTRGVYQLRAALRPGNSGGPLPTTGGQVYGMVFARSVTHPGTEYALAADELRTLAAPGRPGRRTDPDAGRVRVAVASRPVRGRVSSPVALLPG